VFFNVERLRPVLIVVCLLASAGCGGSSRFGKTVPVSGQVLLDGKPLTTGTVSFYPSGDASKHTGLVPMSLIDEQGGYNLYLDGQEGAPLGHYKVVVAAGRPSDPKDEYSVPISLVADQFTRPESTPLTVEVTETPGPGQYDLHVAKKP
jgi:hypothetical protein